MIRTKNDGTKQIGIWFDVNEVDMIIHSLSLYNSGQRRRDASKLREEIQHIKIKANIKFKQEKSIPVVNESCEVCD